jgi:membrane protein insertase Oxa1/YidC/SpoIIIJ
LEFPVAILLATNLIEPIVEGLHGVQTSIFGVVHNYGWTMILLAAIVKLLFWPLNLDAVQGHAQDAADRAPTQSDSGQVQER